MIKEEICDELVLNNTDDDAEVAANTAATTANTVANTAVTTVFKMIKEEISDELVLNNTDDDDDAEVAAATTANTEDNDDIEVAAVTASIPIVIKRKRKNYVKRVEYNWSHDEIMQLIVEVEQRPALWDFTAIEYKLPKTEAWTEVAHAIGNITINDAKAKWANLRISFKNNMAKYRLKKMAALEQGTADVVVLWRYFKPMMFLETNSIHQRLRSNSMSEASPPQMNNKFVNRKRRSSAPSPKPIYDPMNRMAVCNALIRLHDDEFNATHNSVRLHEDELNNAPNSVRLHDEELNNAPNSVRLHEGEFNIANNSVRLHDDKFSAFGNYVASELRALPPDRALFMQDSLMRKMYQLLDAVKRQ